MRYKTSKVITSLVGVGLLALTVVLLSSCGKKNVNTTSSESLNVSSGSNSVGYKSSSTDTTDEEQIPASGKIVSSGSESVTGSSISLDEMNGAGVMNPDNTEEYVDPDNRFTVQTFTFSDYVKPSYQLQQIETDLPQTMEDNGETDISVEKDIYESQVRVTSSASYGYAITNGNKLYYGSCSIENKDALNQYFADQGYKFVTSTDGMPEGSIQVDNTTNATDEELNNGYDPKAETNNDNSSNLSETENP